MVKSVSVVKAYTVKAALTPKVNKAAINTNCPPLIEYT